MESKLVHKDEEENFIWPDHVTFRAMGEYILATWPVYKSHYSLARMKKELEQK